MPIKTNDDKNKYFLKAVPDFAILDLAEYTLYYNNLIISDNTLVEFGPYKYYNNKNEPGSEKEKVVLGNGNFLLRTNDSNLEITTVSEATVSETELSENFYVKDNGIYILMSPVETISLKLSSGKFITAVEF